MDPEPPPHPRPIQDPQSGGGAKTNKQGGRQGGGSSGTGQTGNGGDNPLPFLP